MTLQLQYLKEFLDGQSNLIADLNISITNMNRLCEDKYQFEEQIKKHGFFQHHYYQLRFISIIQLSKLFGNTQNEKLGFYKLCNLLENSSYGVTFKQLLKINKNKMTVEIKSRNDVLELVNEVRLLLNQNSELIIKVIALRNKVYAHTDPNHNMKAVLQSELELLNQLAQKLFNLFQFKIFFTTTRFEFMREWDIDFILHGMSEFRKIKMKDIEDKRVIQ